MSSRFFMDVHVPYAITIVRLLGVDVLRAQEDGSGKLEDAALLDRAKLDEQIRRDAEEFSELPGL